MKTTSYIKTEIVSIIKTDTKEYFILKPIGFQLHMLGIHGTEFDRKELIDSKMNHRFVSKVPLIDTETDKVVSTLPDEKYTKQSPFYGVVTLAIIPRKFWILQKLFGYYKIRLVKITNT